MSVYHLPFVSILRTKCFVFLVGGILAIDCYGAEDHGMPVAFVEDGGRIEIEDQYHELLENDFVDLNRISNLSAASRTSDQLLFIYNQPEMHAAAQAPINPRFPLVFRRQTDAHHNCFNSYSRLYKSSNRFDHLKPAFIREYRSLRNALLDYDATCLEGFDHNEHIELFDGTSIDQNSVKDALVLFMIDRSSVFCMGVIIDDTHVLTAKHCFINPKTGQYIRGQRFEMEDALIACRNTKKSCRVELSRVSTPIGASASSRYHKVTKLEPLPEGMRTFGHEEDLVQVTVGTKFSGNFPAVRINTGALETGRALLLPGFLPIYAANDQYDISLGIRWSRPFEGHCSVGGIEKSCLYHSCQAIPGFSGAPLIIDASEETLAIGGIHLSPATATEKCRNTDFLPLNVAHSLQPAPTFLEQRSP